MKSPKKRGRPPKNKPGTLGVQKLTPASVVSKSKISLIDDQIKLNEN